MSDFFRSGDGKTFIAQVSSSLKGIHQELKRSNDRAEGKGDDLYVPMVAIGNNKGLLKSIKNEKFTTADQVCVALKSTLMSIMSMDSFFEKLNDDHPDVIDYSSASIYLHRDEINGKKG